LCQDEGRANKNCQYTSSWVKHSCSVKPTALGRRKRSPSWIFQFMDRFHDNHGLVKTASIKHLCCESRCRSLNFIIKRYVTSRFFKEKPRRLRLPWAIGVIVIVAWFMVERPPLVERLLHHLTKTWSSDVSMRRLWKKFPQKREKLPYIMWIVRVSRNCPNDIRAGLG